MLTLRQVAERLHVSERTVRREIADGRLRAVKLRSLYRIRPEDLQAYLAAQPAACPSATSATDGKSDCALAVADALSRHYRQAPPEPTRAPSKIRSAARKSILRLVGSPPPG
ncbi:MAG TPA: excisionase family DNA-binding protein [Burkholderiaceae bacterium]|nr:excisionase family DNA-binding protein [Burkholderiaceae bacterium]